jgi:hypothetical protein
VSLTAQELALLHRDRRPAALPAPRGPLTEHLFAALRRVPHELGEPPSYEPDLLDGDAAWEAGRSSLLTPLLVGG